jgi:hypothetical protein
MYNLIVGFTDGRVSASRVLEHTDDVVTEYVAPSGTVDVSRLVNLPTLIMPELQDRRSRQMARVGHVENLTPGGRADLRYQFVPNTALPEISSGQIEEAAQLLKIGDWEFNRSHWAVKDADLYRVLYGSILKPKLAPQVFRLPVEVPIEQDLVAVMMPFDSRFADVYITLQRAAAESGMRCSRADDIWINNHIMDDVINLIWRARVVIADLTSRNTNVFYETGIAHTLGRDVIQIAQSMDDVPFDLRSLRSVTYLHNNEGLASLKIQIIDRLKNLTAAR